MRPKKTRYVTCAPGERCFKPLCKPLSSIDRVMVTVDEFEAMRLACLEGLKQVDAAKRMKVSRPTFSRIVNSAQRKVADGLVNIKAICIEGGCCEIVIRKKG